MIAPEAVSAADIDIANTARASAWRAMQQPLVPDDDRALELQLRNSVRRNIWRSATCLTLRPDPAKQREWMKYLARLFYAGRYRSNHPIYPAGRVPRVRQTEKELHPC